MAKKSRTTLDQYIADRGGEIIPKTNEWELVRFRCADGIAVIYQGKRGISYSNDIARDVHNWYHENRQDVFLNKTSRNFKGEAKAKLKRQLFERDGNLCFYSGVPMTEDIATIEHLIPVSKGGKDNIDNMVLCVHAENQKVGNKSLIEKIKYRESILYGRV